MTALGLIITAGFIGTDNPIIGIALGISTGALFSIAALRFGLLAVASFNLVGGTLSYMPLPLDPGAAYGANSLIVVVLLLGFLSYALRVSVGSRPLFRFALD
jgi:hypothetical protein